MAAVEQMPMQINLGFAPASGRDGLGQANHFKGLMRGFIGRDPDGAYLKEVHDGGKTGVVMEYYKDVPGAESHALRALEMKSRVWDMVEGRVPGFRIVARSRGV